MFDKIAGCNGRLFLLYLNMGNLKTIHEMAKRFASVNFEQVVRDSFEEKKATIASFNRQNLRKGKLQTGNTIKPDLQSIPYAAKKFNSSGQAPFGTPDLFLTGGFQSDIGVIINKETFTTFSENIKAPKLELKYTPLIYGLPDANKPDFVQVVGPVIFQKVKDFIFTGL